MFSPSLACYACDPKNSRGRLIWEEENPMRTAFQRDRERIIHARAFRRLKHKTQVFISNEGDHYRTRLTHTIEVAQIARALARIFALNEDLAEAIALAHDLGHPPFGHVGEDTLAKVMENFGGFDHNAQAVRIVTELEKRYIPFNGLNLTIETLEGLVKHNGPLMGNTIAENTVISPIIAQLNNKADLHLEKFASLEAQCAAIADDLAYDAHDIDDGLRSHILSIEQLKDVTLTREIIEKIKKDYPDVDDTLCGYEIIRRQISYMIEDVIQESKKRIDSCNPKSIEDIYNAQTPLISFSEEMAKKEKELKKFLYANFYHHPNLLERRRKAETIIEKLFEHYLVNPETLPEAWRKRAMNLKQEAYGQLIGDFISGMTDNYAIEQYKKFFNGETLI